MPELPEVETVIRGLRDQLIERTITGLWTDWEKVIATPSFNEFEARVTGQTFHALRRRGKYIVAELSSDDLLVIHLKLTGRLYLAAPDAQHDADLWVHFRLDLDDGQQLRFSDSRKFGRVYLTDDLDQVIKNMGPEPLDDDFTADIFAERLKKRDKMVKALLLDQSFVAGVGNIYADEALHRAGIHPETRTRRLSDKQIYALYETMRAALRDGIRHEGASISWYRKPDGSKGSSQDHFYAYGRTGKPCKTCGHPIEKIRVAQRGTHFCPNCQPR